MPISWPVTPTIPPTVSAGDRITAAYANQQRQALADLWTDVQFAGNAVLQWPADVNAMGHFLVGVQAVNFSGQATGSISGHSSEKALSVAPGIIISSAGNPGNALSVYNSGFIFSVDVKGKVTSTGLLISSSVDGPDFIRCYRQEDGVSPFIVTRAGNAEANQINLTGFGVIIAAVGQVLWGGDVSLTRAYAGALMLNGNQADSRGDLYVARLMVNEIIDATGTKPIINAAQTFVGAGGVVTAGAAVFHGGVYVRSASEQNAAYMQADGTIVGVNYYAASAPGAAGPLVINATGGFVGPGGVSTTGAIQGRYLMLYPQVNDSGLHVRNHANTGWDWITDQVGDLNTQTSANIHANDIYAAAGLVGGSSGIYLKVGAAAAFQVIAPTGYFVGSGIDVTGPVILRSGMSAKGNILAQGFGVYVQDAAGAGNIAYIAANGLASVKQVYCEGSINMPSASGGLMVDGAWAWSGTFTTNDGRTVAVFRGIITNVA